MKLLPRRPLPSSSSTAEASPPPSPAARPAVVVELFTSQGCSSCPPADAVFGRLPATASGVDVIPLAFHVDYWDHLGWRDPLSRRDWTSRQRRYAAAFGLRSMYTPQAIINGRTECVGSDDRRLRALIGAANSGDTKAPIELDLARDGPALDVVATLADAGEHGMLVVVAFESGFETDVARGENAGRRLRSDFVVRALEERPLPPCASQHRLRFDTASGVGPCGVAAFVQDPHSLAIGHAAVSRV